MNEVTPNSEPLRPEPALAPSGIPLPTGPGTASSSKTSAPPSTDSAQLTVAFSDNDPLASLLGDSPGTVFAGYYIVATIGRGGMGVVYKAKQPDTQQIVALKRIKSGVLADQELIDRFLKEVQALGRLQAAKNIIPIYHAGQSDGEFFYVMPFLSGGSLSAHRERFQKDRAKAVALVEKIARAAHQLHQHQILHRDIKPSNIMLDADDEPYLSDFGLAKLLDDDQSLSATNQRLGTPAYMAPEQTGLLTTKTGPSTDVWSLGVLLYELVVGERPFQSNDEKETATLLARIIKEAPVRPSKLKPDLDRGLEAVILKCLEKHPQDRFASAAELADELGRWLRQEGVRTRRTPVRRFLYRWRWIVAALALVSVTATIVAAVAAIAARRNSPEYVLQTLREELIQKGEVVLVPKQGPPRWHDFSVGGKPAALVDHEGHWMLESFDFALVELLRDVPVDTYRIRAELRHHKDIQFYGEIGVYIGHNRVTNDGQTTHLICNLVYNDIVDRRPAQPLPKVPLPMPPMNNPAQLRYRLYAQTPAPVAINEPVDLQKAIMFKPADRDANRWRVLEIELHADKLIARFDGEEMLPVARETAEARLQDRIVTRQQVDNQARFGPLGNLQRLKLSPRGSLGLVVAGSVAVKNVVVTTNLKAPN